MKNYIFTLLLVLSSVFVFGQEENSNEELETKKYREIGMKLSSRQPNSDSLIKIYENNIVTKRGEGHLLQLKGYSLYIKNDYDEAERYYFKALSIYNEISYVKGANSINQNLATIKQIQGDFEGAIKIYTTVLPIFIKEKDTMGIASINENMGTLFFNLKSHEKSFNHFKNALKNYKLLNKPYFIAKTNRKMGDLMQVQKFHKKAKKYFEEAVLILKDMKSERQLAFVYMSLWRNEVLWKDNFEEAHQYQVNADKILTKLNLKCESSYVKQSFGDYYSAIGNLKKSKEHYLIAYNIAKECNNIFGEFSILKNMYLIDVELKNYSSAYFNLEKHNFIKDSLYSLEKVNAINDIETKYQTAEKDKALLQNEVELLSKTQEIDKQNKQFWIVASGLGAIFAILLMGIYFYKKQQALNTKLSELNNFKSQIFTIIGHDLRSPIASIAMSAENDSTKQKTSTALGILDDLLLWGSANQQNLSTQKEAIYFETILDELTDEYANEIQEKDLRFTQNFENCKPIYADKNEMTTILRNLITNAIKYNTPKGTIHVSCKAGELLIENTFLSTIASGTQIGLDIVQKLSENNNCTFEFTKDKLALAKLKFND